MKNKSIQFVIIYTIFCYLVISLCSCHKDDNPVDPYVPPTPGLDTADRYIWTGYITNFNLTNVYAADTDMIYVIAGFYLATLQENYLVAYNLNDPNFRSEYVYGYDKNNIFVIGSFVKDYKRYPELKKITNGNITSYNIGSYSDLLFDLLVVGPDQAWISDSYLSKVYYFNNGFVKEYTLSQTDSLFYKFFYKNKNNELFVFAIKTSNLQNGSFYTYKLINDNFVLVKTDCFGNDPCLSPRLFRCGSDLLMSTIGLSKLKYFNGSEWVSHSDTSDITLQVSRMGGINKDSLIMVNGMGYIYTYGEKHWRKEKYIPDLMGSPNLYSYNAEMKFGNVYIAYWGNSCSTLIVGKANKNTKNKN